MLGRTVRSLRAKGFRETCAIVPAALVETTSATISGPIRRRYSQRIRQRDLAPVSIGEPIDLSVMSFVQENDVPELVASVRSFLVHVGVPKEFIVVSDGTITAESRDMIDSILPGVLSVQSVE